MRIWPYITQGLQIQAQQVWIEIPEFMKESFRQYPSQAFTAFLLFVTGMLLNEIFGPLGR